MSLAYWLFHAHSITPGQWITMSIGERDILQAFAAYELEQRTRRK